MVFRHPEDAEVDAGFENSRLLAGATPSFREGAAFGRALAARLGDEVARRLMVLRRRENVLTYVGLREEEEPSEALTLMERKLLESPLTKDELRRIRLAAGIAPLEELLKAHGDTPSN